MKRNHLVSGGRTQNKVCMTNPFLINDHFQLAVIGHFYQKVAILFQKSNVALWGTKRTVLTLAAALSASGKRLGTVDLPFSQRWSKTAINGHFCQI